MSSISSSPLSVCWRSGKRDVVVEVHRAEQRAVLEQHAELLAHLEQLVVGHVRDRLAVHEHVALVGVEQADHVLDADRLAGARRAEDHRDLVLGDAHVEAAQDLVAAERLVDVDELDRVRRAGRALRAGVPLVLVLGVAAGRVQAARVLLARLRRRAAWTPRGRPSRRVVRRLALAILGMVASRRPPAPRAADDVRPPASRNRSLRSLSLRWARAGWRPRRSGCRASR